MNPPRRSRRCRVTSGVGGSPRAAIGAGGSEGWKLDDRDRQIDFLLHDRDTKFSAAFHALFDGAGMRIIRTPLRAPNANAHVERWVGSLRRECLDRLLILGRRQLEHVLRVYVRHHNTCRPHRALDLHE